MENATTVVSAQEGRPFDNILKIDEGKIHAHLDRIVRGTVEETLNALLEKEADRVCNAERYEHTEARKDTRSGYYPRQLQTKAGEVTIQMPRLRRLPLDTAIIERYRRRESSVEEALMEMYLAGVSVRRIEDITEALWDTRISAGTVSDLNKKLYEKLEAWRNEPITGEHPYAYLDGVWLKRSWGGEVRNIAILVAVGVNRDGYREILGIAEGAREDLESWRNFLRHLKERGLTGVQLFVSDKCLGLIEALGEFYPGAAWQRCTVHFYRNVFTAVPHGKRREVATMLKAIHAQEDRAAAQAKAEQVAAKLEGMRLSKAAAVIREGVHETLRYYSFPREHWWRIRTNNMLERLIREIRRRTRVVGCFPDGQSALMLAAGRLRYMASQGWGRKRYLSMDRLIKEDTVKPAG
jgi:putative transposase